MRNIFVAREEPQKRPALVRAMLADRAAEHRVTGFERIENRPLRRRTVDGDLDLAIDAGERSQMQRQNYVNHDGESSAQAPPLR